MSLKGMDNDLATAINRELDFGKLTAAATYKSDYTVPQLKLTQEELNKVVEAFTPGKTTPTYKPFGKSEEGEEEWIWVTGYKGTDKDMKCKDYQYSMDKQFDMPADEPIHMCSSGFHFCDKLKPVFKYYNVQDGNRFFEVKALVRRWKKDGYYKVEQHYDKMVAKSIQFVRELSIDEIFDAKSDPEVKSWSTEQKEQARQSCIENVRLSIKIAKLVELGYSEVFATYVCNRDGYDFAYTMGMTPNVSMDVKVLSIAMNLYGNNRF